MAADDVLKFKVDLVGNMVSELVAGGRAANTAEGNVQALTAAILQMTEASQKKQEHGFFTFDLAEGARLAVDVVKELARGVYDLGKEIVTTAAHAQDLNLGLRLTAGGPEAAKVFAGIADSYSDTRFDDDEIKKLILPALDIGLGKDNPALLQDIITAATDEAARTANDGKAAEVIDTFQRIHTKREVNAKMLMGLGINEADFYVSLARRSARARSRPSSWSRPARCGRTCSRPRCCTSSPSARAASSARPRPRAPRRWAPR